MQNIPQGDDDRVYDNKKRMRIFAHLAHDKDAEKWARAHAAGTLVGINDDTPFGYGRARHMGCEVVFSRSAPERTLARLVRMAVRVIVGFDYIHSLRNQSEILKCDIVWTQTESQFLAVSALLYGKKTRPKLLAKVYGYMISGQEYHFFIKKSFGD